MKKFRISTTITLSSTSYSLAQGTSQPRILILEKDTSLTNRFLLQRRGRHLETTDPGGMKPGPRPGISGSNRKEPAIAARECKETPLLGQRGAEEPGLTEEAPPTVIIAGCADKINPSEERTRALPRICWRRCFHLPRGQRFSLPAGNSLISANHWWKTPRTSTLSLTGDTDWQ
ncbi:hypothetical protein [Cyclobacterium xiamenense]|uniref:hypothetical protein n=1 Tax=Cyclobacterium xiamenense TaxID=1297121 RepID=UPI0012B7D1AE|nr:hypothetical protein [Cyclobacterium xiamenense]